MLHPYVRQALQHNEQVSLVTMFTGSCVQTLSRFNISDRSLCQLQGTFSADIHIPDVYGVFKFVVEYNRAGYSVIELSEEVPVRPFKHNEFERFLTAAYPYYASAASTMVAFGVFSFVYLYQK